MIRLLLLVGLALALLAPAAAQERYASVMLEDGRRVEGRVLLLNLEMMEIEVGSTVMKIPAAQIRSCSFRASPTSGSAGPGNTGGEVPGPAAGASPFGESRPAGAEEAPVAPGSSKKVTWSGPLPDPVVPGSLDSLPMDQRGTSLWRRRIEQLDRAYPWLVPAAPSQWISIGLLLLVGASLVMHLSVSVASGEPVQLGKSVGMGIACVVSGLLQVAMVPVSDLSIVLMLLGNTSLLLFGLCTVLGLARFSAAVALCVQLGFAVLVFGILELVTALLGSVGASA